MNRKTTSLSLFIFAALISNAPVCAMQKQEQQAAPGTRKKKLSERDKALQELTRAQRSLGTSFGLLRMLLESPHLAADDFDKPGCGGLPLLHTFARLANVEFVNLLLDKGVNPTIMALGKYADQLFPRQTADVCTEQRSSSGETPARWRATEQRELNEKELETLERLKRARIELKALESLRRACENWGKVELIEVEEAWEEVTDDQLPSTQTRPQKLSSPLSTLRVQRPSEKQSMGDQLPTTKHTVRTNPS